MELDSTWGVACCGMWQYSHALPARVGTSPRAPGSTLRGLPGEETARLGLHDGDQIDGLHEVFVLHIFH